MKNSGKNLTLSLGLALALMFGGTQTVWGSQEEVLMEEVVDVQPNLLKSVVLPVVNDDAQSGCSVFCTKFRAGLNTIADVAVEPGLQVGLMTLKNLAEQLKVDPDLANKPKVVLAMEGIGTSVDLLVDAINAVRIVRSKEEGDRAGEAATQAIEFGKKVNAKISDFAEDDGTLKGVTDFLGSLLAISNSIAEADDDQRVPTAIAEVITLSFAIKNLVFYMQKQERDFLVVNTSTINGKKNKEAMTGRNNARLARMHSITAETLLVRDGVKKEFSNLEWATGKVKAKEANLLVNMGA